MTKTNILEWTIFVTAVICSIAFLLWVISDIVPYAVGLSKGIKKNNDAIKLKYAEFISNYILNPERYTFDTGYFNMVRYMDKDKTPMIYIYFSFIDAIKFHIWKRKLNKSNKINEQRKSYQRYLTSVEADKREAKRRS